MLGTSCSLLFLYVSTLCLVSYRLEIFKTNLYLLARGAGYERGMEISIDGQPIPSKVIKCKSKDNIIPKEVMNCWSCIQRID